ncbi:MAG: hypothetical protein IKH36_01955 [Bacilli bacterium]|nr:hypothetical protein [Bacilli bacterium]
MSTENEEKKTRKPSQKFVLFEIFDKNGEIVENATAEKNIQIIGVFPKLTEEMFDEIQKHPHAVRVKL